MKNKVWEAVKEPIPTQESKQEAWKQKDNQNRATIVVLFEDSQLIHIRNAKVAVTEIQPKGQVKYFLLKRICKTSIMEGRNMEYGASNRTYKQRSCNTPQQRTGIFQYSDYSTGKQISDLADSFSHSL